MENREEIVAEYFELRVLLNTANLMRDEKTEIEFRIESARDARHRLLAMALGKNRQGSCLEICFMTTFGWVPSNVTRFDNFELFCAGFLTSRMSRKDQTNDPDSVVRELKTELRSLWISK